MILYFEYGISLDAKFADDNDPTRRGQTRKPRLKRLVVHLPPHASGGRPSGEIGVEVKYFEKHTVCIMTVLTNEMAFHKQALMIFTIVMVIRAVIPFSLSPPFYP